MDGRDDGRGNTVVSTSRAFRCWLVDDDEPDEDENDDDDDDERCRLISSSGSGNVRTCRKSRNADVDGDKAGVGELHHPWFRSWIDNSKSRNHV